jgi:hypothetical protein
MSEEKKLPPEKKSEDQRRPFDPKVIGSAQGNPEPVSETNSQRFPEDKQAPVPKEPQTKSDKPETETMEVHHHGHVHETKKWKEYIFQFFMLFLAVFCGFLAEYQLEHTIEHNREKQFMRSMLEDLQKDAITLENESKLVKIQYERLDSLTEIIYESPLDPLHVRKMYELQRRYLYPLTLRLINRTELQLTNSGGMRLIRNRKVADSIIYYWSITELLYETKDNINIHRGKAKDISFTLFSNKYVSTRDTNALLQTLSYPTFGFLTYQKTKST